MLTIIGLGNPEKKYEHTRHNFGFLVLEALRQKFTKVDWKKKKECLVAEGSILNKPVKLVLPQTFMNNSGAALANSFDKKIINDCIVIHDDLDLLFGSFKLQKNISSAGHRGVESIIETFGTKDFYRLRLGIGHEPKNPDTEKFVLEKFTKEEMARLPEIIQLATDKIIEFIKNE